jgi:hypothetical protein
MNSRRNFIVKGGLAATALVAANPFKSIASAAPVLPGINSTNSVLLLHATTTSKFNQAVNTVAKLKRQNSNAVTLHTQAGVLSDINFDAKLPITSYQIIFKGNIKIGVIGSENVSIDEINAIAGLLKKDKQCNLVVCLSQLGFKNKFAIDDIQLAQASANIDVIISNADNSTTPHSMVILNKNQEEVIISPTNDIKSVGKIDIRFDKSGKKNNISLSTVAA